MTGKRRIGILIGTVLLAGSAVSCGSDEGGGSGRRERSSSAESTADSQVTTTAATSATETQASSQTETTASTAEPVQQNDPFDYYTDLAAEYEANGRTYMEIFSQNVAGGVYSVSPQCYYRQGIVYCVCSYKKDERHYGVKLLRYDIEKKKKQNVI